MVVSLLMVSGMPVQADSYSWMESAKKVKINSTIKGVARNNQPPTLMDPWDSYEEYFYFKAPVKMNITITVTMKGTQGVSVSLYNSRGNYLMDSNDWLYNRSKNQNSTILRSTCNAGEYYIRLNEIVYTKIRLRVQSHTYLCLKRRTIHIKIRSSGKPDSPLTSP